MFISLIPLHACWAKKGPDIYKLASQSVYLVEVFDQSSTKPISKGSAVALSHDTLVTNCHVLTNGFRFYIADDEDHFVATVLKHFYSQDVCLLLVQGVKLHPSSYKSSNQVAIGDQAYALGSPLGLSRSFTQGIISQKHFINGNVYYQTDSDIYPVSSGGGLFDENANLIGITSAAILPKESQGAIGMAISIDLLIPYINGNRFSEMKDEPPSPSNLQQANLKKLIRQRSNILNRM